MGGKTTTTSQQTVDPAVQALQLQNYSRSQTIADTPVTPYSGSLDLSGVANTASGLMNYQAPTISGAQIDRSSIPDVSTQTLPQVDLSGYMDPYVDSVVNNTNSDIERARQAQRVSDSGNATIASAWGGSRQGVVDTGTNEAALRTVASSDASLRSAGFTQAQNAAQTDLARKLQADLANQGVSVTVAQANAMLSEQTQIQNANAQTQGAQVQLQAAGLMGDTSQAEYNAQYQEFLRQQQDPLVKQQLENQSLGGVSVPITTTNTQAYSPGLFDYAKLGAQVGAAALTGGASIPFSAAGAAASGGSSMGGLFSLPSLSSYGGSSTFYGGG